ncbi:DeoR/GlpR family DNA-binding transcription regulator [uncultured Megasphaera sp.]|uniref:DeoR/GlpR family DNA-binding transcription regulator n=1 Tax=uncultured Megasphaera sp. TaxID=165188 RepID=UPI00265CFB7B|nr:DeoR/GlpR family DNA-binding transcription regulator [uncultured Megasphaera sp.]
MLTEERQAEIMRIVNMHGAVSVQELVNYLDISESTVRRDLAALDEEGLLRRVHGGATSLKEGAYDAAMEDLQDKYSLHIGEKRRIAQFAASLVRPGDFVYLDGGSTVEQMADFLVGSEASFVTNGLPTAQKLARSGVKVYVLPGLVKGKTESVIGSEMRDMLSRYHFTKGFFGTNGLTPQEGCTTPDVEEAACKGAAVRQCRQAYVLADVSKFGQSANITFADLSQVTIVTAKGEEDMDYSSYESLTEVHIL